MNKSEMQAHAEQYRHRIESVRAALRSGQFTQALHRAEHSWPCIDGMLQYARKYEAEESVSIEGINVVLKLAPLLLSLSSLDNLESLLRTNKRIVKFSSDELPAKLLTAREQLWMVHRVWDYLEGHIEIRQDDLRNTFGGNQDEWRALAMALESLNILTRIPDRGSYRLFLATRTDLEGTAKCPKCGSVAASPKFMFFDRVECPTCRSVALFVLLDSALSTAR